MHVRTALEETPYVTSPSKETFKDIRTLDDAMSKICDVTQQRELIRSTGDALEKGKSSVLLGKSFVDVTRMISGMGN